MTPQEFRQARLELGLSLTDMAELLHLCRSQIVKLQSGKHKVKKIYEEILLGELELLYQSESKG